MELQRTALISDISGRYGNDTLVELQGINRCPIDGYQHLPLQSLEEATKPIVPFVPDLVEKVALAKRKCNKNSTTLTLDESAAIYLYTMPISFFYCLNKSLRAENREELKPWFPFLRLFMSALEKLPSSRTVVWRAISKNITTDIKRNEIQTWWSVNSCSTDGNLLKLYFGKESTIIRIQPLHGKDISEFSAFQSECEIVLPPGTRLRVQSSAFKIEERLFFMDLEEIPRSLQQHNDVYTEVSASQQLMGSASNLLSDPWDQSHSKQFKSDKIELWEQCDGKGFTVRRVCGNSAKCYARDISYWQCRPNGNCPADWPCAQNSYSTNPSLSLKALKEILTAKASKLNVRLNWMESIVDLAKLLGLDIRRDKRIQLALKLGYKDDVRDSYNTNVWLHNKLMKILAQNGGNLPRQFYESQYFSSKPLVM
ncbi:unnamed protein product [Rotaria socialis]|uniref:NAD(P)(+)--arginine ADP-ribosyltransferase n=1 Tax=Rotaria socialis TaxID=392032 RepID=A0A821A4M6_9BILA|nr:unnamed protein product [Rotaria socialis]CAF4700896.1 unnamed protein product [Rotaria socialis]